MEFMKEEQLSWNEDVMRGLGASRPYHRNSSASTCQASTAQRLQAKTQLQRTQRAAVEERLAAAAQADSGAWVLLRRTLSGTLGRPAARTRGAGILAGKR